MTETFASVRARILATLAQGPTTRFGSDPLTDRVLRSLKKEKRIVYEPKGKGGQGWRLVEQTPA